MPTRVFTTRTAHEDLLSIFDYIALDNPKRAISFIEQLALRAAKILSTFPNSGARYKADLRFLTFYGYVVVYEYDEASDTAFIYNYHGAGEDWKELE